MIFHGGIREPFQSISWLLGYPGRRFTSGKFLSLFNFSSLNCQFHYKFQPLLLAGYYWLVTGYLLDTCLLAENLLATCQIFAGSVLQLQFQVARMFAAQNAVFKELLREQRKCYDGALSAVMNEILIALGESEVIIISSFIQMKYGAFVILW